MVNSRAKGKRGELEARDQVREHWTSPKCIRAAQANGAFSADLLNALPDTHVEVKRRKRVAATDYLIQALTDKEDHEIPVVLMREDNRPEWVVMFYLRDTDDFVQRYISNICEQESE